MDKSSLNLGVIKFGAYYYIAIVLKESKEDILETSKYHVVELLIDDNNNHIAKVSDVTNDFIIMSKFSPVKAMVQEVCDYGNDKVVQLFQPNSLHLVSPTKVVHKNDIYELVSSYYKQVFRDMFDGVRREDNMTSLDVIINIMQGVLVNERNRNERDRLQFSTEA